MMATIADAMMNGARRLYLEDNHIVIQMDILAGVFGGTVML